MHDVVSGCLGAYIGAEGERLGKEEVRALRVLQVHAYDLKKGVRREGAHVLKDIRLKAVKSFLMGL